MPSERTLQPAGELDPDRGGVLPGGEGDPGAADGIWRRVEAARGADPAGNAARALTEHGPAPQVTPIGTVIAPARLAMSSSLVADSAMRERTLDREVTAERNASA